jgi:hypothetical protein
LRTTLICQFDSDHPGRPRTLGSRSRQVSHSSERDPRPRRTHPRAVPVRPVPPLSQWRPLLPRSGGVLARRRRPCGYSAPRHRRHRPRRPRLGPAAANRRTSAAAGNRTRWSAPSGRRRARSPDRPAPSRRTLAGWGIPGQPEALDRAERGRGIRAPSSLRRAAYPMAQEAPSPTPRQGRRCRAAQATACGPMKRTNETTTNKNAWIPR